MIIHINTFSNSISFTRNETKKLSEYFCNIPYDHSLITVNGKIRAIEEINNKELLEELKKEKNHQLILSDDVIGFSTYDIPLMSRKRMDDIFTTRFRLCFPNYNDYFFNYFEYTRDEKKAVYFVEFSKRDTINKLINAFKHKGINIKELNNFGTLFTSSDKSFTYPIGTLIIGDYSTELVITRGSRLLAVNRINIGNKVLLNKDNYLNSSFNFNNDEALSFSGFMKESIGTREEVNDQNILAVEKEKGLSFTEPKEIRLLKEDQLTQYNVKNNFRKYYGHVTEIVDYFNAAPWYFPLKEINVISTKESYQKLLEASREDNKISFIYDDKTILDYVKKGISNNPLYAKRIQRERRKIDWAKFLTMDIGIKKKG